MTANKRGREREKSRVGAEMSSKKGRVGMASKSQAKQREQDRRGVEGRGANRPQCAEPHDRRVTDWRTNRTDTTSQLRTTSNGRTGEVRWRGARSCIATQQSSNAAQLFARASPSSAQAQGVLRQYWREIEEERRWRQRERERRKNREGGIKYSSGTRMRKKESRSCNKTQKETHSRSGRCQEEQKKMKMQRRVKPLW